MTDLFGQTAHDPGGRLIPMPVGMFGAASFGGPRDCYRYRLVRQWDVSKPTLMSIGMNPSSANPLFDDPTIAKLCRYGRRWGFGKLWMGNVFAYRCTDQGRLSDADDPIGPDNDSYILKMARSADMVLVCHGNPKIKALQLRGPAVVKMLRQEGIKMHVLKLGKNGCPYHPLYLPDALDPVDLIEACRVEAKPKGLVPKNAVNLIEDNHG